MKEKLRLFMYASVGILALVAAFQLGVSATRAEFSPGGFIVGQDSSHLLTEAGEVWSWNTQSGGWWLESALNPPVPVSEIATWQGRALSTHCGELWYMDENTNWQFAGSPPGGVRTQDASWSQVKANYEEE